MTMTTRRRFLQTAGLGGVALGLLGKATRSQEPAPSYAADAPLSTAKPRTTPTMWSGAVTTDGATVKAKLPRGAHARLLVTPVSGGAAQAFDFLPCAAESTIGTCLLQGLAADTAYSYRLELEGRRTSYPAGRLRTFPAGPASFRLRFRRRRRRSQPWPWRRWRRPFGRGQRLRFGRRRSRPRSEPRRPRP